MKYFHVKDHLIDGQHVREYPNALRSQKDSKVTLAVKQYQPKTQAPPDCQQITIIAAHGNGLQKELYEATWDELYEALRERNVGIRSVWIADSSHQGASGVLNEAIIGDDANWFDHSRDLLHMTNCMREHMVRPIVGFAHSMGCAQLVQLSIMHPRLLSSLILVEPVIQARSPKGVFLAMMSSLKPDLWKSREEAETALRKNRAYRAWDPRVMNAYLTHGLRRLPTALYPTKDNNQNAVTLTTTKHQEAWTYVRPSLHPIGNADFERRVSPELDPEIEGAFLSYRAECLISLQNLPFVRPPVFWIHAEKSPMATPELYQEKLNLTGVGMGGNGGVKTGRVANVVIPKANHFVIFEQPGVVARLAADWLSEKALGFYNADEEFHRNHDTKKSKGNEMREVSEEWIEMTKKPSEERRGGRGNGKGLKL